MGFKRILLVVHDDFAAKLLLNRDFLEDLTQRFHVTIATPLENELILPNQKNLFRYGGWPLDKVLSADVRKYARRLNLYYIFNSMYHSSFQKLMLKLGISLRRLNKLYPLLWNLNLLFIFSKLFKHCYSLFIREDNWKTRYSFENQYDGVLLSRPDSIINIAFDVAAREQKTTIITLIRNWDTPYLKGINTTRSDFTLVYDSFLISAVKNTIPAKMIGEIKTTRHPLSNNISIENNHVLGEVVVLYATNDPKFVPREVEVVKWVLNVLNKCNKDYRLVLRLHPKDTKSRYEEIIEEYVVSIQEDFYDQYYTSTNEKITFPNASHIREYVELFKNVDVVLSVGSTIVYDALLKGCRVGFIKSNYAYSNLIFKREHIQLLISRGVTEVTSEKELLELCFLTEKKAEGQNTNATLSEVLFTCVTH